MRSPQPSPKLSVSPATPRERARALVAGLSDAQIAAYLASRTSERTPPLADFVSHCLIVAKEGETESGLVPFTLWPAQREALAVVEREPFLVWPKGRQIGATWLELAAMLHAGTVAGNRLFNIARQSDEYAQDGIRRLLILAGYDPNSDPPNLRVLPESTMPEAWRPQIVGKTTRSLTFANGSRFKAKTATRSIARGDAAYWTLCDEYAFWPWPEKQLAALEHGASRVHVVSTGDGEGDAFHKLYQTAARAQGKWRPHFTSAAADPRRDAEWFRQNVDEAASPDLARRELARSVEDVFRPASGNYFARFSAATHVREFAIVANWPLTYGVDFGFVHPVCLLLQQSPAGQPFVVGEYLPEEVPSPEFAAGIVAYQRQLLAEEGVDLATEPGPMYCDPAGKARNMQTSRSEFDVMLSAGFRPRGVTSSLRDGCDLLMTSIAHAHTPLVVHPRCTKLIRALTQMPPDSRQPDVYLQSHPVFSHPLDALRYWFVNTRGAAREEFVPPPVSRPSPLTRTF